MKVKKEGKVKKQTPIIHNNDLNIFFYLKQKKNTKSHMKSRVTITFIKPNPNKAQTHQLTPFTLASKF